MSSAPKEAVSPHRPSVFSGNLQSDVEPFSNTSTGLLYASFRTNSASSGARPGPSSSSPSGFLVSGYVRTTAPAFPCAGPGSRDGVVVADGNTGSTSIADIIISGTTSSPVPTGYGDTGRLALPVPGHRHHERQRDGGFRLVALSNSITRRLVEPFGLHQGGVMTAAMSSLTHRPMIGQVSSTPSLHDDRGPVGSASIHYSSCVGIMNPMYGGVPTSSRRNAPTTRGHGGLQRPGPS